MNELFVSDGMDNRVSKAALFSEGAYVSRQAGCEVAEGMNRIAIEVLAHRVDGDSAQARVFGQGEILSVQYQSRPSEEHPQPELRELETQEQDLKERRERLEGERKNIARNVALLDSVAAFSKVQVPREIQTHLPASDQLGQLLQFLDSNGEQLLEREARLARESRELDRKLETLKARIKQLGREKQRNRKQIEILFNARTAGAISVEASYLVHRVGWQPVYKIDAALDLSGAELARFASVTQNSGEPWREIELTLSNAIPSTSGELPEPFAWHLRRAFPPPMAAMAGAAMGGEMLEEAEPMMMASALSEPEAEYLEAEREDRQTAWEYRLPMAVDLESDEKDSLLPIDRRPLEGRFNHYAVPRLDPLVYLVFVTRPEPEWPAGRVNIHFGGRYVGNTEFDPADAGEETRLNLGPDRSVRILHEQLADKIAETFFGKVERNTVARELHYRIEAENLKQTPIELELFDAVPVSDTDRYQVRGVDISPRPADTAWRDRPGITRWLLAIPAQESEHVDIRFSIKHPKDDVPMFDLNGQSL